MNPSNACAESPSQLARLSGAPMEPGAADDRQIQAACDQACQAIAPSWPLDRAIAVNPHWTRIGMPLRRVAARMQMLAGFQVFPARDSHQTAWDSGRISAADLELALGDVVGAGPTSLTPARCLDALRQPLQIPRLPLLIDFLDDDPKRQNRLSWRQAATHQISQTCAAYFDEHQAEWQPERAQGLYGFWRDTLRHDHGIGVLMGLPGLGEVLERLPQTPQDAQRWVLQRLQLAPSVWADYLEAALSTVHGWASWCAYLGWQARLEGRDDPHLQELLAIRLAWGAILLESKGEAAAGPALATLQAAWAEAPTLLKQAEADLLVDEVWQTALEKGYQRALAQQLAGAGDSGPAAPTAVEAQMAFCIDVRSEPLRRALEAVCPAIQTIGFAGFFGVPAAYTPLATTARRPQLPGLLAPTAELADVVIPPGAPDRAAAGAMHAAAQTARLNRFGLSDQWLAASRWPGAAFSYVEAAGVGYLGQLARWVAPGKGTRPRDDLDGLPARYRDLCRPQLVGMDLQAKVALAARVLHAMGLERNLAPLVLLVGHGSQSRNNAQGAALDCGACCGQSGEVNARSLAHLLNDAAVRTALSGQGIAIGDGTCFVAALHNTTTDQIEGFDLDLLPPAALAQWQRLSAVFAEACDRVRRERAPQLGIQPPAAPEGLLDQLRRRANDGAQTRPEWGLAGNAALVIAPRDRSRGADLQGRAFLHDYDAAQDADGTVLEMLMTAPMVVAHWINWQYHASTCEPRHLGSGNKLLHNVVGGSLGVFEGNGGDLRIGLSRQSLHDGTRWIHEPLRLTVVVDAPQQRIDTVVRKHAMVEQLLHNGWVHLWRFDGAQMSRYVQGRWHPVVL